MSWMDSFNYWDKKYRELDALMKMGHYDPIIHTEQLRRIEHFRNRAKQEMKKQIK